MAWTTPRSWIPGELVTASMMNTHVRDNLNYLKGIVDTLSAAGSWTNIAYNSANFTSDVGTWVVENADQVQFQYAVLGKIAFIDLVVINSTITGAPVSLQIGVGAVNFRSNSFVHKAGYVLNGSTIKNAHFQVYATNILGVTMQDGVLTAGTNNTNIYVTGAFGTI